MNEIEITEENYEMYDEFDRLANPPAAILPFASRKEKLIWNVLSILSVLIPLFVLGSIYIIFSNINTLLTILLSVFTWIDCYVNIYIVNKIIYKMNIKTFKKQHPDFDINIDIKEVAKALKKYKELSKVPKNIEKKKEEHLTNLPDEVRKMSTNEKLAYLDQEKEFWEQVAVQEKYTNLDEQKENQIQKSLSR